jgi:hypothetical protein
MPERAVSGVITLLDGAGHFIEHWLDRAGGLLPFGPKRVSSAMIKSKGCLRVARLSGELLPDGGNGSGLRQSSGLALVCFSAAYTISWCEAAAYPAWNFRKDACLRFVECAVRKRSSMSGVS